jgi:hypothetical protein
MPRSSGAGHFMYAAEACHSGCKIVKKIPRKSRVKNGTSYFSAVCSSYSCWSIRAFKGFSSIIGAMPGYWWSYLLNWGFPLASEGWLWVSVGSRGFSRFGMSTYLRRASSSIELLRCLIGMFSFKGRSCSLGRNAEFLFPPNGVPWPFWESYCFEIKFGVLLTEFP